MTADRSQRLRRAADLRATGLREAARRAAGLTAVFGRNFALALALAFAFGFVLAFAFAFAAATGLAFDLRGGVANLRHQQHARV